MASIETRTDVVRHYGEPVWGSDEPSGPFSLTAEEFQEKYEIPIPDELKEPKEEPK